MKFCEDYRLPEAIIEPLRNRIQTNLATHFGGGASSEHMVRTEKKSPKKNGMLDSYNNKGGRRTGYNDS